MRWWRSIACCWATSLPTSSHRSAVWDRRASPR
nr:MAG TPA: hypothetical protein [Caudoviricetes sp.]